MSDTSPLDVSPIVEFVRAHQRLLVITGAGCSQPSGIPAYRDHQGNWQHPPPVQYAQFIGDIDVRRRYWARSAVGWHRISGARPNAAHTALAELERRTDLALLVTQNVDRLHSAAGSRRVIDLHGRLDQVRCLGCGSVSERALLQRRLEADNPRWHASGEMRPDGDVDIPAALSEQFSIPACEVCGGILKPDVVFFGENVPGERVEAVWRGLDKAAGLLVVGSSLTVFSGFRFVREAHRRAMPIAAINLGRTRADELISVKLQADCCDAVPTLVQHL